MKQFKQISKFPDYYINSKGFVWSSKTYKYIRPYIRQGYLRVRFHYNNKVYCKDIHRLLLETFVGPCPDGMECCHNNGVKTDNKLGNLRWDTHKNNCTDAIKHGTHVGLRQGELSNSHKLTEKDVINIIHLWNTKLFRQQEIANLYNITRANISLIVNRKIWRHI